MTHIYNAFSSQNIYKIPILSLSPLGQWPIGMSDCLCFYTMLAIQQAMTSVGLIEPVLLYFCDYLLSHCYNIYTVRWVMTQPSASVAQLHSWCCARCIQEQRNCCIWKLAFQANSGSFNLFYLLIKVKCLKGLGMRGVTKQISYWDKRRGANRSMNKNKYFKYNPNNKNNNNKKN